MKTIGNGKYLLYAENLYKTATFDAGYTTLGRKFNTIRKALNFANNWKIPESFAFRLIRTTDNKNLTGKIYPTY